MVGLLSYIITLDLRLITRNNLLYEHILIICAI